MTDEAKKSDTELAIEFIERGQNALGQANVTILVRPEKLIEKIEKEIEKVRCKIRELQGQIGQIPEIDTTIMSRDVWQNGDRSFPEYFQIKEKFDSGYGKWTAWEDQKRACYQEAKKEFEAAREEYERRKTDPKYYDQYVSERRKTISEAEILRDQQIAAFNAEIEKQEKRVEKFQEYVSLLIEKTIGLT